jgi:hypothetical protein
MRLVSSTEPGSERRLWAPGLTRFRSWAARSVIAEFTGPTCCASAASWREALDEVAVDCDDLSLATLSALRGAQESRQLGGAAPCRRWRR